MTATWCLMSMCLGERRRSVRYTNTGWGERRRSVRYTNTGWGEGSRQEVREAYKERIEEGSAGRPRNQLYGEGKAMVERYSIVFRDDTKVVREWRKLCHNKGEDPRTLGRRSPLIYKRTRRTRIIGNLATDNETTPC